MRNKNKKGITLVELVLSVFIFSFVMFSIFSLYGFSVVQSYKQSREMNEHVNTIANVEKHEVGVMQNVTAKKNIRLFSGFGTVLGSDINVDVTADTFTDNKKTIVSVNPSDENVFDYFESEIGKLGMPFAKLLLSSEVGGKDRPEEYRNKVANYFTGDEGNYKHTKMDFSRYDLPKGHYKIRYLLYDKDSYRRMFTSPFDARLKCEDQKKGKDINTLRSEDIRFQIKDNDIFSSYESGGGIEKNDKFKIKIIKRLKTVGQAGGQASTGIDDKELEEKEWLFFNPKKSEKILPPGHYALVFELTLESLDASLSDSEKVDALKAFQKLRHLSKISKISDLDGEQRLIARDIIFLESLEPNIFVNAGKELYIGSNFDGFNLTKQELGRDDGVIEYLGELPNATLYYNGRSEKLPKLGLIYNKSDKEETQIYPLNPSLVSTNEQWKSSGNPFKKGFFRYYRKNLDMTLNTYASSLTPHNNGTNGMTFFLDKEGNVFHTDQRYGYASGGLAAGSTSSNEYFRAKNGRLFNANTMNFVLLDNGHLLFSDTFSYTRNSRYYKPYSAYQFSDVYVDLGNDSNEPTKSFLGFVGNQIKKIDTGYRVHYGAFEKEHDSCKIEDVDYDYLKYKKAGNTESMEKIVKKAEIRKPENLGGYVFKKFFPLSKDNYLILAEKSGVYELFMLFNAPYIYPVKEKVLENKRVVGTVSHRKKIDDNEMELEKKVFEAEVFSMLRDEIRKKIYNIKNAGKSYLESYREALLTKVKDSMGITSEIEINKLDERIKRMIDDNLDQIITEYIKGIKINIIHEENGILTDTLFAEVSKQIDDFDFVLDDGLDFPKHAISQTLYPKIYKESPDEFIRNLYYAIKNDEQKKNQTSLGFELYGSDLYAYTGNMLYRLNNKLGNQGVEKIVEKVLETKFPIKNIYIHDKSKFIEVK